MRTQRPRRLASSLVRPTIAQRSPARSIAAGAVIVMSVLVLTGCQASPAPASSASQSARTQASGTPSATSKAPSDPTPTPTPVTLACDQVLTTDQLAAIVPPLTPATGFTPAKGSDAAKAAGFAGVACGYTNAASGNTVAVSVARPAAADLTALKNHAITSSHVVPTYGVPPKVMGYFTADGSLGVAQAFESGYWIVAASKDYIEPGDASQVIADVLANIAS
jgi:hypothetical protein